MDTNQDWCDQRDEYSQKHQLRFRINGERTHIRRSRLKPQINCVINDIKRYRARVLHLNRVRIVRHALGRRRGLKNQREVIFKRCLIHAAKYSMATFKTLDAWCKFCDVNSQQYFNVFLSCFEDETLQNIEPTESYSNISTSSSIYRELLWLSEEILSLRTQFNYFLVYLFVQLDKEFKEKNRT